MLIVITHCESGIGNANTSATSSESEVRSEAIDLDDEEVGVWLSFI